MKKKKETAPVKETPKAQTETTSTPQGKEKEKAPRKKRKPLSENSIVHTLMPIFLLAFCAFFGICIYTNVSAGIFGNWFGRIVFGLLGKAAYFVPVLFLFGALFWKREAKRHVLTKKLVSGAALLLLVAVLFYIADIPDDQKGEIALFWRYGRAGVGGGILGNLPGLPLYFLFGKVTAIIFSVLFLVVSSVLFFGIDLKKLGAASLRGMKRFAKMSAEARKKAKANRAEADRIKREKREDEKEEFYTKKTVARISEKSEKKDTLSPARENHFMLGGESAGRPTATRQFYDADTDFGDTTDKTIVDEDAIPTVGKVAYDDEDFFSKVPDSPYAAPTSAFKAEASDGKDPISDAFVSDDDSMPQIEIVGNRPIPSKSAASSAPIVSVDIPMDDEDDDVDGAESEEITATVSKKKKKDGEGEKLVINEAHTIEHVGVDTFVDEKENEESFFYSFPPLSLLHEDDSVNRGETDEIINEKAKKLMDTLDSFGVEARISCVSRGPRLTRYELVPKPGVKIRSIENLVNEIAMNLEAVSVRIEAPIPGKAALGIEVPNTKYSTVRLRGLLDTDTFRDSPGKTTVCLGVDVVGTPVFADLDKMPHLLVAGATGMGKSVCINSILVSLLYKARPDEVKLILIDPKKVEFKSYYNIPHLLVPVVTEAQKAAGSLSWAVNEMERRYDIIERVGVRNIKAYNATLADHPERERMTQIVIVIDELHDLMLQAREAVEDSIARIAAKARAAGILLIIGTQRPSVNVITGVIKANIPSRIAFHVASQVDSRTILDTVGAEKLLNNGDMLFLSPGMQMMAPKRVQGAFLDDDEVLRVAEYLRTNSSGVKYDESIMADMDRESEKYNKEKKAATDLPMGEGADGANEDDLLYRAIEIALENSKISTSLLQRKLSIGFGKAARLIDRMEELGVVSALNGQKPREILITMDEYRAMRLRNDE